LRYTLDVTNGRFLSQEVEYLDFSETIDTNGQKEIGLRYSNQGGGSANWVSGAYTIYGTPLPSPTLKIIGNTLYVSEEVYGVVLVTYRVVRHIYVFKVTPYIGAEENRFQCFAWAVWDGGTTYVEIDSEGYADSGLDEDECNKKPGSNVKVIGPEDAPREVDPQDERYFYDWCDLSFISKRND
jgi:hypothetical protein